MKRAWMAAIAAVLVMFGTSGCLGRMAVSGVVRKFNLDVVESKWAREAVFLLLYVVPVYPIAGMIDLVIVNSLEFHTGTNPVNGEPRLARVGESHVEIAENGTRSVSTLREDGSIDFAITTPDGMEHFLNLEDRGEALVARDVAGRPLGYLTRDGHAHAMP